MKISVVIEVSIDDTYLKQVETWGIEPSDHIATIIAEPMREKGLVVKATALEIDHTMFDRLKKYQEHLAQADAYNDIEEEIIARACIGGKCDD